MGSESVTEQVVVGPTHDSTGWRIVTWTSFVAGIISFTQMIVTAVIAFLPYQQGNPVWEAIVMISSPGLPIAFIGIVTGLVGLRSAFRQKAVTGIALSVLAIVGVFVLILVAP